MLERQPIEIIETTSEHCTPWQKIAADREEINQIMTEYAALRMGLRDSLMQAGVGSNPGWLDSDITGAVANKLGVEDRYQETLQVLKARQER